jgi:cobalt-zinc-cadmium efflux system membrane fusion protein
MWHLPGRASPARLIRQARGGAWCNVVVRSPISGRVVDMTAAAGGYWNDPSQPILTVADLSQVWFSANVQEKDLSRIEIGAAGDIVLNAYPEEPISGKVFSLGEILNPDTRTSTARIALQNSQAHYRPAMFGQVTF